MSMFALEIGYTGYCPATQQITFHFLHLPSTIKPLRRDILIPTRKPTKTIKSHKREATS